MTYYEELGIGPDASIDEIRHAYKLMARLLHPDTQVEPKLKALAECQMKRLGDIAAVLADPERRRQYDDSLLPGTQLRFWRGRWPSWRGEALTWPGKAELAQLAARHWFWILIAGTVLGLGGWNIAQREPAGEAAKAAATTALAEKAPEQPPSKEGRAAPRRNGERRLRAAAIPPPDAEGAPIEAPISGPLEPEAIAGRAETHASKPLSPGAAFPQADEQRTVETSPAPSARNQSTFAGTWLYSPEAADAAAKGEYPAVYVEFVLGGPDGALAGDYHARYRIPDRAVSPEVVFEARGAAAEKGASLQWSSRNGAKGRAELTLRTPDVMHVTWWTTEFGKQATLASGTAVLIRQRTP